MISLNILSKRSVVAKISYCSLTLCSFQNKFECDFAQQALFYFDLPVTLLNGWKAVWVELLPCNNTGSIPIRSSLNITVLPSVLASRYTWAMA